MHVRNNVFLTLLFYRNFSNRFLREQIERETDDNERMDAQQDALC